MIERHRGDDKKWKVDSFNVDNSICCYCGLCEEACNFDAIKLTPKYEFSTYDKPSLIYDVQQTARTGARRGVHSQSQEGCRRSYCDRDYRCDPDSIGAG